MKRSRFVLWSSVVVLGAGFATAGARAQRAAWQPSPGHTQLALWPGAVPDAAPTAGPEYAVRTTDAKDLVAGSQWSGVEQVSRPTMTVYSPTGRNTGVAVVVYPGGGYQDLAIDLEGTEVCDWLTTKGITCVLLKYRVMGDGKFPRSGPYPDSPMALEDAQRTMGLLRLHAAKWHIDPHKIGVMGFSAGGHLVAAMSVEFARRVYTPIDAADKQSCRPDFAVAIYPGHLTMSTARWDAHVDKKPFDDPRHLTPDEEQLALNPAIHPTRETPPTFLLQNEDDNVDGVNQSLVYYIALKNAGVPVEMHLYAQGGHAFGLRKTRLPVSNWPQLVETWLRTIGMIAQ